MMDNIVPPMGTLMITKLPDRVLSTSEVLKMEIKIDDPTLLQEINIRSKEYLESFDHAKQRKVKGFVPRDMIVARKQGERDAARVGQLLNFSLDIDLGDIIDYKV